MSGQMSICFSTFEDRVILNNRLIILKIDELI